VVAVGRSFRFVVLYAISRLLRVVPYHQVHDDHDHGDDHWWNPEQPAEILGVVFGNPQRHEDERDGAPSQQQRAEVVDRNLPELNHQAEDAGETPALRARKPSGVDLDHARRAKRLGISVGPTNNDEQQKHAAGTGIGRQSKRHVQHDGQYRADGHGLLATQPVGE
jgi:hypothetical protein